MVSSVAHRSTHDTGCTGFHDHLLAGTTLDLTQWILTTQILADLYELTANLNQLQIKPWVASEYITLINCQ